MKRCFWIWCLFISVNVLAQNRSNVWMLSYQHFSDDCGIKFTNGIADTFSVWKTLDFFATNSSICDTNGNLLFYTNGIWIANKNNDSLQNTTDFNPGWATDHYSSQSIGMGTPQGVIILPKPNSDSLFEIFHVSGEPIEDSTQVQPLELRFSEVDMSIDNSLGAINSGVKNIQLVEDTLVWGRLTACKHANGRDWWIITHRWNSTLYYKDLLTPDSIYGPFEQNIGSIISKDDYWGQACFSPDGSKFAYINCDYNFDYMEFNRCSGEFFNHINIVFPDSIVSQGLSFSPNSRFIYCNTYTQLFQYDTWNTDMSSSIILIDTVALNQPGIEEWFAEQMLAPDSKIYISTYHGVKGMHVINYPDSLGVACGFTKMGLLLPAYNVHCVPNHPNYDLGPLSGSDCDTLYLTNTTTVYNFSFSINPNPSSNILNIVYNTTEDCLLTFFDINGKQVASISLFHYFKNRLLNVSELPPGVYLAVVSCKGERVWSEKVVVQR